jgi:ABC-type Fe3+ transport system substrate-binding protein
MTTLLDLVRARRTELEAASPDPISDDRRLYAILALQQKAAEGDPAAKAAWRRVQELFARAGSQTETGPAGKRIGALD